VVMHQTINLHDSTLRLPHYTLLLPRKQQKDILSNVKTGILKCLSRLYIQFSYIYDTTLVANSCFCVFVLLSSLIQRSFQALGQ